MLGAEGVAGHEAARADAGMAALRRAAAAGTPFDLAILDAQMPDQDGFELAALVRADRTLATSKLLILTSAGQRGDGERCREMGIQAYLTKPIARADLIEAVRTVLAEAPPAGAAPALITRHSIAESRPVATAAAPRWPRGPARAPRAAPPPAGRRPPGGPRRGAGGGGGGGRGRQRGPAPHPAAGGAGGAGGGEPVGRADV